MGFNTVAMILNDHMHELEKSPHAFTYALCNPPHHGEAALKMWQRHVRMAAEEHGEGIPNIHPFGGMHVLPTFHADSVKYLYAGRNTLHELEFLKFGSAKVPVYEKVPGGLEKLKLEPKLVSTVTLILPDWADPRKR